MVYKGDFLRRTNYNKLKALLSVAAADIVETVMLWTVLRTYVS